MRLLNVSTLEFEEYVGEVGHGIPTYAILSHTWEKEEVSFADYIAQDCHHKKGYEKITAFCRLAQSEGFQYAWIDTCCIDKRSSAELSEAINSMFQWYRDAAICYAYLVDVNSAEEPRKKGSSFSLSRWFTRGWTLQELLAPAEVVFLGSDWEEIGTKKSLRSIISDVTSIDGEALEGCDFSKYSVAQKMSWAAGRHTTRPEDQAYCLMGLFDVNMPMLYGEGRKAFLRLQQEILKLSEDHSMFAWSYPKEQCSHTQTSGLLASSPEHFRNASRIQAFGPDWQYTNTFEIVNRLVRIQLPLVKNVTGIKLQESHSPIHRVVEVQQDEGGYNDHLSQNLAPQPDTRMADCPESPGSSLLPTIVIDSAMGSYKEQQGEDNEPQEKLESNMRGLDQIQKSPEPIKQPYRWEWFIYEPVVIAPLRCHIGGSQLGILLSKGSVESTGLKVLSRLHNPSIMAFELNELGKLASLWTTYASMSTIKTTMRRLDEAWGLGNYSWPEIRIGGVVGNGYALLGGSGNGWQLDDSGDLLWHSRRFQTESDMLACAPLAVFFQDSDDDEFHPMFFFTISKYDKSEQICRAYVGFHETGVAEFMLLDYQLFSFDLAHERRVEVPITSKRVLVAKLREGTASSFISLSIEEANQGKTKQRTQLTESEKIGWLNSRLFPFLRSLHKRRPASVWLSDV